MGRPKLNIFLQNIGFNIGTKERILRLYPSMTFTAAVRRIVENHLSDREAQAPSGQSFNSTIDELLSDIPKPGAENNA